MPDIKPRDFTDIWAFVRVVEVGTFSGAARQMGSTKANLSKQVARLERSFKTKLLNRSTRQVSLTEAGFEIYQHAMRMTDEAKAIEAKIAGLQKGPSGTLRVSTSMAFGNVHIAGLLAEFIERYPDIQVVLSLTDRYVDLLDEGLDVAIRLTAKIKLMSAVARPIAPLNYVLAASPAYVDRYGAPTNIQALTDHRCLTLGESGTASTWNFLIDGETLQMKIRSPLAINSSQSLRIAMLSDVGIALLPTYVVGEDIKQGKAIHILPDITPIGPFGNQIYAVYLQNKFLPLKVRVFIDYLVEKIGEKPYWDDFLAKPSTKKGTRRL